jgi:heme a synthase
MAEKRSIFEEVQGTRSETPSGGMIDRPQGARRGIRLWLFALFLLVVLIIVVGGLTRLTDSGLSITEWDLVMGTLPPMSAADWDLAFQKYQSTPEYAIQNKGMSLDEFKVLFWWEWGHRVLGRIIGLVWAVGFLGFLVAKNIPTGWTQRLFVIGVLIGLQGAIGWWMVHSGLQGERLDVLSWRLALHLGLAFAILGVIAWFILLLGRSEAALLTARRAGDPRLFGMSTGLTHLLFLQILLGALVAGIDAGRGYTDWPLMAGEVFPSSAFELTPLWRNFIENDALVQFIHRLTAYLLLIYGIVAWTKGRRSPHPDTKRAFHLAMVMLLVQAVLGIVTVMQSSPLHLAILHQLGAVLLWVLVLNARFQSRYPIEVSVRNSL